MRVPVRITVLSMFSVLMILIVGAVTYSNYRQGEISALETAHELVHQSQIATIENTHKLLGITSTVANTVTRMPNELVDVSNPTILAKFLRMAIYDLPDIYSAYIGFPDGRFVQALNLTLANGGVRPVPDMPTGTASAIRVMDPVDGSISRRETWRYYDTDHREIIVAKRSGRTSYDPRVRPWFKRAQRTESLGASEVYIFQSLQEPGITVSAPMRHVTGAVMGIDMPLDGLAQFVARQKPGPNGELVIVARDGQLIAHRDPSMMVSVSDVGEGVQVPNVSDIRDPRLNLAGNLIGGDQIVKETVVHDGKSLILSVQPVDAFVADRWYIIGVASVEDFTGALRASLNKAMVVALMLLVCALFVVFVVASWIASPLSTASEFASKISRLDLNVDVPATSPFKEIQMLRSAMVSMRDAIQMFLRYAPKDLVHVLVRSGETAEIGGTRKEIAVLFTDIENFTSITENEAPEDILIQTSLYFEAMTEALSENQAIVDKFIGDAIMALWNTPIADEDYIDHACRGTLASFHASEELNTELSANNFPVFRTRFGLHAGEALVGNVGSPERMQYTALGPVVNLASRIEGMNKYYGTNVLVSGDVREKASGTFVFRKIDVVEAKGTTIPVALYELLGTNDDPESPLHVEPHTIEMKEIYEAGLEKYIAGDFQGAMDIFDDLLMADPTNGAALVIAERCNRYLAMPPENWNGVFSFESK